MYRPRILIPDQLNDAAGLLVDDPRRVDSRGPVLVKYHLIATVDQVRYSAQCLIDLDDLEYKALLLAIASGEMEIALAFVRDTCVRC